MADSYDTSTAPDFTSTGSVFDTSTLFAPIALSGGSEDTSNAVPGFADPNLAAVGGDPTLSTDAAPSDSTVDANTQVWNFDDGGVFDPSTNIYTDASGTNHAVVGQSPDGTVLQFDDGEVFDSNSGTMYASMNDFLADDGSGQTAQSSSSNAGAGAAGGNPNSKPGGGGASMPLSPKGATAAAQNASGLSKAISSLGSMFASILGKTAQPAIIKPAAVAQAGVTPLSGINTNSLTSQGTMLAMIVFGALALLVIGGRVRG